MSEKRLDRCGRWRNVIVAFRVSKEEGEAIDEAVALSGHSKQDYIISKLLNREVVVEKSPRTYKLLKDKMDAIYRELLRIENAGECSEEFFETIRYVTSLYVRQGIDIETDRMA